MSLYKQNDDIGLSYVDISTGETNATVLKRDKLIEEIAKVSPSEIIINDLDYIKNLEAIASLSNIYLNTNFDEAYLDENILKQYDIEYEIKPDCAKVTLIGNKVTETPGVIAKIMRALNAENITLLQSSDSYNSLSCLVDEKDMVTTVHVIHNAFSV